MNLKDKELYTKQNLKDLGSSILPKADKEKGRAHKLETS
jgi:hypothetical protein